MKSDQLFNRLKSLNPWHLLWMSVLFSELFTLIGSSLQSYLFFGSVPKSVLLIGAVDALFVPLLVVPIIIFFLKKSEEITRINEQLRQDISERRKFEAALQENAEKYRALIETTATGYVIVDENGCVVEANQEYVRLTGHDTLAEIQGRQVTEWTAEWDRERNAREVVKCLETGYVRNLEIDYQGKNGAVTQIEINATVLRNSSANRILTLCRDITEHRQAEETLRVSERRYRQLYENMMDAFVRVDMSGRIVEFNTAYMDLTGYSEEEIRGLTYIDITPARWHAMEAGVIEKQVLPRGYSDVYEKEYRRKDGTVVPIELRTSLLRGPDGRPSGMWAIIRNITERRQAEKALQASEAFLEGIFQAVGEGIICVDRDFRIISVNREYCQQIHLSCEEIIGRHCYEVTHHRLEPCHENSEICTVRLTFETGEPHTAVHSHRDGGGEPIYVETRSYPIRDANGNIVSAIETITDITEQKKNEIRILKYQEHLEELVDQRTREYEDAKKQADAANLAKGEFLANMSHEIRTPLNAVLGMTHLAFQTDLSPRQEDYLRKIRTASNSLLSIINDILDFSKIEANKLEMESIDFTLEDVLFDVSSVMGQSAQEKGLAVRVESSPEVPSNLKGDPLRLKQVLINLCSNAVKFTEVGGILLSVTLEKLDKDRITLCFSIHDTGIGMSQGQISGLFRPFTQADASLTRRYGGSGLGLAISKRLVEMMNGKIWAVSEPGKGSEFFFTAEFGAGREPGRHTETRESDLKVMEVIQGARVLLVEDNEINRQVAQELLSQVGITVVIAGNGRQAVEAVRAGDFDAVLMDVQMPVMDGYEATKKIRCDLALSDLPVIAMTAHAMVGDREKALAAGMNDYVNKPIKPSILYATLAKWIKTDKRPSSPGPTAQADRQPEQDVFLPCVLPGISVDTGLQFFNNNRALYRESLGTFVERHGGDAENIRSALAENDLETAVRISHTMKSAAAYMGALELSAAATDLEKALKDTEDNSFYIRLEAFERLLAQVLNGLKAFESVIRDEKTLPGEVVFDIAAVKTLISEMSVFLDTDMPKALERLEELGEYLQKQPAAGNYERLVKYLASFDTDNARKELEEIVRVLDMTLEAEKP